jgi:hypothetical protein
VRRARESLVTDGCASFNAAGAEVSAHGAIIVGKHTSSDLEPFRWVNTFISNAKTAITGTYHHFDSPSTATAILPRRSTASIAASTCPHCSDAWLRLRVYTALLQLRQAVPVDG